MFEHYNRRSTMVMLIVLALFLGVAIGLGIATWIAMSTLQMDMIMPGPVSWVWA